MCIVAATPGAALGAPGRRDGCRGGRSPFSCAPRTSSGTAFGGRAFGNIAGNARPGTPSGTSPGTSPGTPVGTSSRPRGAARRGHLNGCRRRPYGPQAEDMRQGHRREHRRGAAFGNANGVAFQGMHAAPGGSGARRGRRNGCRRRQYGPQAEDVRQGHRREHRRGATFGNASQERRSLLQPWPNAAPAGRRERRRGTSSGATSQEPRIQEYSNVSREHRRTASSGPTPSGTSPETPSGASSRPGQQRLACVRGRLCCAVQPWLCSLHGFSTLHLGRWNLIFRDTGPGSSRQPPLRLAALAFKAAVPKILAKFRLRVLPRLREPSTHLTGPGRVWSSLVAGQRVAS